MWAAALRAVAVAIVIALAAPGPIWAWAKAADAGRWLRGSDLLDQHVLHTAPLLPDGRVLVAGGTNGQGAATASAELFDATANRWTRAASMGSARAAHSATLLSDGDVLVTGGEAGLMAATLMRNGTVLVTGGSTDLGFATAGAEVFDPAPSRRQPTTWPMATPRSGHSATLLPDGRVLLVGGRTSQPQVSGDYPNNTLLTTSEIFDVRGNIGVRVGYSKIPRLGHTATLLRTGRVLVVGSAYSSNADAQLFDPSNTEEWLWTGLRMDRYFHPATALDDGRVLIAGGFGVGSPKSAWIFSPVSGASDPSSLIRVVVQLAAVPLVLGLGAFGGAVASGHLRRRRPRVGEPDSERINP